MNDDTLDLSRIEETLPQDVKSKSSKIKRGLTFEHILSEFDKIDEKEAVVAIRKHQKKKKSHVIKSPKLNFEESQQDNPQQPSNQDPEENIQPRRKSRIVSKTPIHRAPNHFHDPSLGTNQGNYEIYENMQPKRREHPDAKLTFSSKVQQREEEAEEQYTAARNPRMTQKKSLIQLNVRQSVHHDESHASAQNSLLPRLSYTPHTQSTQGWDGDYNRNMVYSPKVLTEAGPVSANEDYMLHARSKPNKRSTVRIQLPALSQDSTPRRLITLETPGKSKISSQQFGFEQNDHVQSPGLGKNPLILYTDTSSKRTEEDLQGFDKYSTPQNKKSLLISQGFPSAYSQMGSDFILKTQLERKTSSEHSNQNSPRSARGVNWTTSGGSNSLINDHRNRQTGKIEDEGVSIFKKLAVSELVKPKYVGS